MNFTILRTLRRSKKIKLIKLSKDIGISPAYLSMIENNKRSPVISIIEDICNKLDCELRIIPKT